MYSGLWSVVDPLTFRPLDLLTFNHKLGDKKMKLLTYLILIALAVVVFFIGRFDVVDWKDWFYEAEQSAVKDAMEQLNAKVPEKLQIAVLPFGDKAPYFNEGSLDEHLVRRGEKDYEGNEAKFAGHVMELVQNMLATHTKNSVYNRHDRGWDEIINEITMSDDFADVMNTNTIQKLGNLTGAQALLYGAVLNRSFEGKMATIRISMHLSIVKTGQNVWGTTVSAKQEQSFYRLAVLYIAGYRMQIIAIIGALFVLKLIFGFFKMVMTPR